MEPFEEGRVELLASQLAFDEESGGTHDETGTKKSAKTLLFHFEYRLRNPTIVGLVFGVNCDERVTLREK